jgi:hypothetical protein
LPTRAPHRRCGGTVADRHGVLIVRNLRQPRSILHR